MRTTVLLCLILLAGCTQQQRARNYGGTAEETLPAGQKLVNVTWDHDENLWYLVRPMRADEAPESYELRESSSFGVIQGTVILHETR